MCGVAVVLSTRHDLAQAAIARMVESLHHRGPDGRGITHKSDCWLGHTRLSIIDPSGGSQPMTDDSGRYHLSFNGEIYNFREIRKQLEDLGNRFCTRSDTETLLLAFRQWGDQAVDRLNGQFAFVVWDSVERRLFAARDRLGEKPLYYAIPRPGELVLASEIKAILAATMIEPRLNREAVSAYLYLNYVPPCMTIYENVHTLEPGQSLVWQVGTLQTRRYWQPRLATARITPEDAAVEVRRLLEKAVERQMVADTPVGAFLSGGLDSSTIVALMTATTSQRPKTFAAGFGELINELPFARAVAARYGTEHAEKQMELDVAEMVERMANVFDEPFGDSSNIPTFLLSQFARRQVKVVLSGDGADELFGGYAWYQPLIHHSATSTSFIAYSAKKIESQLLHALAKCGLPLGHRQQAARAAYRSIREKRAFPDLLARHIAGLASAPPGVGLGPWSPIWGAAVQTMAEHYQVGASMESIDRAVSFDVCCYLPGDIFVKVDRAAMAHGLETRSPFMDVDLVEFVMSLPADIRFQKERPKALLRQACEDLWPAVVRGRGKQGFGAPIAAWLDQPAVRQLRQRVLARGSVLCEFLPASEAIAAAANRHPQLIWNLLCLGLWMERRNSCVRSPSLAA